MNQMNKSINCLFTLHIISLFALPGPYQVGACIVNTENKIVGIGYNGMPRGCNDNLLPWGKTSANELENKYMYGKCTVCEDVVRTY